MAWVPKLILETLEELVGEEVRMFHWYLYSDDLEGFRHIPKCKLEGVDRPGTVDLLVQTYGYDNAVNVTVYILTNMQQNQLADTVKQKYEEVSSNQSSNEINHHAIQDQLKSTLREKYQNIYEGNAEEGDTVFLNKIYTELRLIEGAWRGFSPEHEVRQQRIHHATTEETIIKASNIFKPNSKQEKRIRTVLTQGIPGVGKTVCVQKFTLSWAEGEENQDITFLFPLPFRELNPNIGEVDYSLVQLLHQFFPDMKSLEMLGNECRVLFIFDGLDETLLPLNFKHNKVLRDETEPASLDVLITNLITGDLLGNALIWITSRPAAARRIPRKHIHQWTEVKGFADEQREEYFRRRLCDENLAIRLISHVKSSRSLYVMCQIPVFCWITVTVMKKMLRDNLPGALPKTLTNMYAYLLLCQTDRMEGHYPVESDNIVLKLAELAYRQLEKGKLIFYKADLKECGMDVNEATIYSGVCTELFMMEGKRRREVFSFVHLTVQEFLAALYAHHSYLQRRDNVFLGYLKRMQTRWLPKSLFKFHKTAIQISLERKDGHWDLFLQFLLGLSLESNQELLGRILNLEAEGEEDVARTIQFIKKKIREGPECNHNLFHCLSELRDESLVQEIQSFLRSGTLAARELSPSQWSALSFALMTSDTTEEEFDLKKYIRSEEGVARLLDVITSSTRALLDHCNLTEMCCKGLASALNSTCCRLTELDLSHNSLKVSGVKLLSVGSPNPLCKLKILRLQNCKLDRDCCETLAVALSTESTKLRELDLSANDFQKTGVKVLCVGLHSHHCKLETLRLNQCRLNESCCEDLASVLYSESSHLKYLELSNNSLKDSGVSQLTAGLRNPHCRLETLRLSWCDLTQKCCDLIGSALSSDSTRLRELDLAGNKLQGPHIKLLCAGLRSPHCKLETLRVNGGNFQKCCAEFASVLSCDSSHLKELNLSGNDLQDSEVKLLSEGLSSPYCKLETLRLSFCGITEEGCTYLASALSSNPSCLRQLDLSYNYLQDSGVKLVSVHLDNPLCKLETLSVDHNAACYLKSTLKKYACTLTFDTNTVAKSLFLYEGGKQVTWVRERQQYPGNPERFESVSQLLFHPGLTESHYWEVEWEFDLSTLPYLLIGVREYMIPYLTVCGSTDQSWRLYCSWDHSIAWHNQQSVEIPAPLPNSCRVGVYLDRLGGTLSFYSVSSGTLSHIHTFYSTFTEPLYAGFGKEFDGCSVYIYTMGDLTRRSLSSENWMNFHYII